LFWGKQWKTGYWLVRFEMFLLLLDESGALARGLRETFPRRLSIERNNAELWLGTWEIRKAHWKIFNMYSMYMVYIFIYYYCHSYHLVCAYYSIYLSIYLSVCLSIYLSIIEYGIQLWSFPPKKSEFFPSGHVTASSVPRCGRAHSSTNGFGASHGHHFFGTPGGFGDFA
jgi:hypothetical protein